MLVGRVVRACVLKNVLVTRSVICNRVVPYSWNAVNNCGGLRCLSDPPYLVESKRYNAPTGNYVGKRLYCNAKEIPIVDYKEIKDLPKYPEKLLIDVREPEELVKYGQIPTSINIPLHDLVTDLAFETTSADFQKKFGRKKPTSESDVIFTCMAGIRARKAAEAAKDLGFQKVKYYKGSWADWAEHEGIPLPSS